MKRFVLIAASKLILFISPILWKLRYEWAFYLHQYIGWKAIKWHHKYKLNVLKDHEHITLRE